MNDVALKDFPPTTRSTVDARWGLVTVPGFLAVPNVLLVHQKQLKLTSVQLNVLLNVLAHWHSPHRMPFPHTTTIAKRMGSSPRSVQRTLAALRKKGFLAKVRKSKRSDVQAWDVTPLVKKLEPFALERIKLTQERDFTDPLTLDHTPAEEQLPPVELPPASEMFRGIAARFPA